MNKVLVAAIFIIAFSFAGYAQEICTRYTPLVNGFSICIPDGWKPENKVGDTFTSFFGPAIGGLSVNLNFKDAANSSGLSEFVEANVAQLLKSGVENVVAASNIKLVSRSDIYTVQKVRGIKVSYRVEYKGLIINSTQYMFAVGGKKVIATFTGIDSDREAHDKIFDASAKSFLLVP